MLEQNINSYIAKQLHISLKQVIAAAKLIDEGNTIPFISRYRKEATGELKEEQLRSLSEILTYLRNLVKRQEEILKNVDEQGKLTEELKTAITGVEKLQELEDIYLPYKQKKRTRAMAAREKGLEPLAALILGQAETTSTIEEIAAPFIDKEKDINTFADAVAGAMDIIAESETEKAPVRSALRKTLWNEGIIETSREEENDPEQAFLMYSEYSEPIRTLPSHRILAINRGEKRKALKVKFTANHEKNIQKLCDKVINGPSIYRQIIIEALTDGYKRLLFPALEREIRSLLTENAEKQAINIFGANLKQLLLQAPLAGHVVMGLDPGYRTGCKMAVVDATGQILDHGVLYITMSDEAKAKSAKKVLDLIKKYNVSLISIGNGTASFETEEFTAKLIADNKLDVHYLITSEAGASVYSASKLAVEELPDYDVTIRGAVSIARRIQDPLAELVKIDPKAIGVGQYQHDVNQKELSSALDTVIESAVNHVGVTLNTASAALLKHIAGINASIAKNIVNYRDENGEFKNRKDLLKVKRLGQSAFTQCAGFLRINEGTMPLDNTPVHPESYKTAEKLLDKLGFSLNDLKDKKQLSFLQAKLKLATPEAIAKTLDAGVPTIRDIIDALSKPGRDPREDLPAPLTRKAVVKLDDIKVGTIMRGTVRNITDFGVFVDIGIKTAGLIHISELSYKRVKHPLDVVSVGDILDVMVINVDAARNRIGLSLKQVPKEKNA
ncbi:Tex family protein [Pectinatus sottacetonis]|uniref:Tex family protein n=1 Tax=Pectinatus sottacetonis TaxID=1002795 RepID=UPI0018C4EAAD|nr:Tex family protein [Pectinatus sottacetonis]